MQQCIVPVFGLGVSSSRVRCSLFLPFCQRRPSTGKVVDDGNYAFEPLNNERCAPSHTVSPSCACSISRSRPVSSYPWLFSVAIEVGGWVAERAALACQDVVPPPFGPTQWDLPRQCNLQESYLAGLMLSHPPFILLYIIHRLDRCGGPA